MIQSITVTITGAGTDYLGSRIRGYIKAIKVVANTNANLTLVVTGETTAVPILTAANITKNATTWFHPRTFANSTADGAAATDAFVEIPVYLERIKAVVSVAATGTTAITVYYEDNQ